MFRGSRPAVPPMRLGVICEPYGNAYYRAIMPMRALEKRGHTVVWPGPSGEDAPMRELRTCDLVHCYRRIDRISDLRSLSAQGVTISFDNDDNFRAAQVSERGPGLEGNRYNREVFRRLLKAAKLADITTTPSTVLADVYRDAGVENVTVIENRLERTMLGFGSRSKHHGTVVGWVAAREHSVDLDRIPLTSALEQLLDTHPTLRVITIGLRLPLRSQRYEHIAEVPFPRLLTRTSAMDIGIAPLADTAFNHSRSDAKIKEYSSGGTAWLASPVAPYRHLGEAHGGRLVEDGEWFAAIDHLIRSPRERKDLARRALKWAKQQTIDRHVDAWETAFHTAITRNQQPVAR
jgi:hypothetical protein